MTKKYLQILVVIAIFAVNGIKGDDTIEALRKILKELNAPIDDRYDETNHNSKVVYHPRHSKHYKSKHGRDTPNLLNVQTMNLFLKPNKRQRDEADLKRILRMDTENVCKATGRCGCTGSRCGNNREDDLADEVNRVVDEINKQLARDDDESRSEKNRINFDDERDGQKRDEVRKWDDENDRNKNRDDENDRQRHRVHEDRIKKKDKYYNSDDDEMIRDRDDDDDDYREKRFKIDSKNRNGKGDLLKNKRIKVNDKIDVVILNESDLDFLLRNEDFVDFTRNDVDKDIENQATFERVFENFKNVDAPEIIPGYRSSNIITPEDFFGHFETIKQEIVAKVFDYVKNKKLLNFLSLKHLSPYQKSKLRSIKLKHKRGEIKDDALEEEIVKILFGDQSNMKIVAQTENSNKIYVPQWMYDKVLSFKNIFNNNLRVQNVEKRILPLTLQQKERLNNKEKGKSIPKLVWRKNASQDVHRFGIPFDFEVHGLGQVAP